MPVTLSELLKRSDELATVSDTSRLDTEVLLCHVLGKNRTFLYTWPEQLLSTSQQNQFQTLFNRRLKGEPIAHLTGTREFWSLSLNVSSATLIPRPDTELLVELALGLSLAEQAAVLDLGTGTGAIALALASEKPHWNICAVDAVAEAVALADENRRQLGFDNVRVFQSDWFSELNGQTFDLVISNPPYISASDDHLQQGDVRFEPGSALVADEAGFADLSTIISNANLHLSLGGWLILEHGYEQGDEVRQMMSLAGFSRVATHTDLAGLDRATIGHKA
ncbi:MAG: peptide chain release factor N(5)-glutamine methyltransferase [Porticoccus sp.]|nr:peptide chain release factor N(5)-glutamine methyltransferase [Porticoccus sp.]MBQ0807249.1 peptide chain release factor N(5)-glutamine methyltransferase [Porticoccus sp.]